MCKVPVEDSEYHSHYTSCVPAVMTEVMENPDVIQLLLLRALSLARKVALSWAPGEATAPSHIPGPHPVM